MDTTDIDEGSPRDEIARLETRIEQLVDKLEKCRKVSLAARISIGAGAAIFVAGILGAIRLDLMSLMLSITAIIGGLVLLGSNNSTANETADEIAEAEAERVELIGSIRLEVVENRTLH